MMSLESENKKLLCGKLKVQFIWLASIDRSENYPLLP